MGTKLLQLHVDFDFDLEGEGGKTLESMSDWIVSRGVQNPKQNLEIWSFVLSQCKTLVDFLMATIKNCGCFRAAPKSLRNMGFHSRYAETSVVCEHGFSCRCGCGRASTSTALWGNGSKTLDSESDCAETSWSSCAETTARHGLLH